MDGVQDQGLRDRFIGGMSHAACTVNIVTTDGAAGRAGVTVSAMASVVTIFTVQAAWLIPPIKRSLSP